VATTAEASCSLLYSSSHAARVLVFHIRCSFGDPLEATGVHDRFPGLSIAGCRCRILDFGTVSSRDTSV
jgi:hypothetical protein